MSRLIADSSDVFGTINVPQGVAEYNTAAGGIGILLFVSRIVQLIFIVGGIIVVYNFISAGFVYLTSEGDSKAHEKVKNQVTYSVIGLVMLVLSFGFASLLGTLFFGDPTFFLNPVIQGPTP
jgi:hypothetical protein